MGYPYSTQGYTLDNAGRRLVVDPVTRIEGHLRCEVNINDEGVITNAVSSGTMFRGLEIILKGRDPRDAWAFTERICGVCTGTHALASVRAVEKALGITIPDNANLVRNLMQLCLWFHDHLVHFYHLGGLDWVDVVSAASADPVATSELAQKCSPWPNSSPGYFASVRDKLQKVIASGQLGLFKNGYWGNPGYKLPPEGNLMVVAHYLEALDFQKDIVKIHTVFGGKNPHPNWLVGGVPSAFNIDGIGGADVINVERLELVRQVIGRCRLFAEQVLIPDAKALGLFYPEWFTVGAGLSSQSVLSYGEFPMIVGDESNKSFLIPRGAVINGEFEEVLPVDLDDPEQIQEQVDHAWYSYPAGVTGLHPFAGRTDPKFALGPDTVGTRTNIGQLDENGPYSWIKTPRWRGQMMEVGPLARVLIAHSLKHPELTEAVETSCAELKIPTKALCSTLGRILARALEARWSTDAMQLCLDRLVVNLKSGVTALADTSRWEPNTWPAKCRGAGYAEAPRGALGHWVTIQDRAIEHYQCVVPTTWNSAARSKDAQISTYEASLLNTKMLVPEQPLEILRTLHSFDPCLACATHIIGPDGEELLTVQLD